MKKLLTKCTCSNCELQEENKKERVEEWITYFVLGVLITLLMIFVTRCNLAQASTITQEKAILACLGEAEGEPYIGKVAMLEALRNRNTLKGVYGYKAIKQVGNKYLRKNRFLSKATVQSCKSAWIESATSNYVKGADHWEAIETFGKPKWSKKMIQTAKIGNHTFLKNK